MCFEGMLIRQCQQARECFMTLSDTFLAYKLQEAFQVTCTRHQWPCSISIPVMHQLPKGHGVILQKAEPQGHRAGHKQQGIQHQPCTSLPATAGEQHHCWQQTATLSTQAISTPVTTTPLVVALFTALLLHGAAAACNPIHVICIQMLLLQLAGCCCQVTKASS